MDRELVMYVRTFSCGYVTLARQELDRVGIPYREINVDQDPAARERLLAWTGYLSVPTLIIAAPGSDVPHTEPAPLELGSSPRGIDRGPMLTEPGRQQLRDWLRQSGFVADDALTEGD